METKSIRIREDVYERLHARRRDDESVSELIDRLLEESTPNWRRGFGTLPEETCDELETIAVESRSELSQGLSSRQNSVVDDEDLTTYSNN
ncbi:antitoxin VapB family protein [Natronorubrum sp. DTA28]|uniref:antitoxin VapB family protein n=1 Tax=Natronorubrum sp. DTA28 TaxID=3447019 RepID=UPI003F87F2E5